MNSLFAAIVALTNSFGTVSVDTLGARVLSYVPNGGRETLAMLPSGYGGIPLCWPWFQFNGPKGEKGDKHGIVRDREFEIVELCRRDDFGRIVMRLESDAATRLKWPYDFSLVLKVELDCRGLALTLTGINTGDKPFLVTEAFHPYFLRSELENLNDSGSGFFRTWNPGPNSHLRTSGLAPEDWRLFICIENGVFNCDQAYMLRPGQSNTLSRIIALKRK